jgi:hypothetical protein
MVTAASLVDLTAAQPPAADLTAAAEDASSFPSVLISLSSVSCQPCLSNVYIALLFHFQAD